MSQTPNTVYTALEGSSRKRRKSPQEPIYKLSVDAGQRKIYLEKRDSSGFVNFDTTYAILSQTSGSISLDLWSAKNKCLLGTLTNQENQWKSENILQIVEELKSAEILVKEKTKPTPCKTNRQPSIAQKIESL